MLLMYRDLTISYKTNVSMFAHSLATQLLLGIRYAVVHDTLSLFLGHVDRWSYDATATGCDTLALRSSP